VVRLSKGVIAMQESRVCAATTPHLFAKSAWPYAAPLMLRVSLVAALAAATVIAAFSSPATAKDPLDPDLAEKIRAYVHDALGQLNAPGAAVVVVGADGIEFAEGFGTARDDGTPVTPQTPFQVASLSKELTSIAVMQLVERRELSLDKTVHSYVGWFGADGSDTALITIRDLLAHTSGWSAEQGLANRLDESTDARSIERNVRRLAAEPLDHAIGTFEYSNANYDALGYLVEVVSGASYEDYMTEHVLRPLQMTHTHLSEPEARADGLAQGHYPFFGFTMAFDIPFAISSLPSSFIAASAEDLGHVLIAHLDGGAYEGEQVLEASSMALLRRPLAHPEPWSGYGWGWWSYPFWDAGTLQDGAEGSQYDVPVMVEHSGGHATYASEMAMLPDEEIGVVVLINMNDEVNSSRFYQLHAGIAQILLGRDAPPLRSDTGDPLAEYGKVIAVAWVLVVVLLVAWSFRRYRQWSRDPASTPRGLLNIARRMILPLLFDVALLVGFWWLLSTKTELTFPVVARLIRLWPDLGLILILVTALALSWGIVGATWTILLLRPRAAAEATV
jgi:CubicO group peptidase (beta-lactamase class C family)